MRTRKSYRSPEDDSPFTLTALLQMDDATAEEVLKDQLQVEEGWVSSQADLDANDSEQLPTLREFTCKLHSLSDGCFPKRSAPKTNLDQATEFEFHEAQFADEIALLSEDWDISRMMLETYNMVARDWGVIVSFGKTELLRTDASDRGERNPPAAMTFLDHEGKQADVKVTRDFKYLGSILSSDCSAKAAMADRTTRAR